MNLDGFADLPQRLSDDLPIEGTRKFNYPRMRH